MRDISIQSYHKTNNLFLSFCNMTICVILVLPFLAPKGMLNYLGVAWENSADIYLLLDAIVILLLFLAFNRRINNAYWLYGLFYVPIIISTVLNGREVFPSLYYMVRMIAFCMLVGHYARMGMLYDLLSVFKGIVGINILITLYYQFVDQAFFGYTKANNYVNFFESDNQLGYWYIPFILLVFISGSNKSIRKRGLDLLFWSTVCVISLVKAWSATCLAVFVFFLVAILLRKIRIVQKLTPWSAIVINLGISYSVIFLHVQNWFEWLIVDILHKNLTLSGRVFIWEATIINIMQKPLLGYGTTKGGRLYINGGLSILEFSHNIFLEVLIQGGIIALIVLLVMYFMAKYATASSRDDYEIKTIIVLSVFCLLLMQFSEFALYEPFVNLPLILCFFYNELIEQHATKTCVMT